MVGEGPDNLSKLVDLVAQVPDAGVAFVQPVFQTGDVLVFFPGIGRPARQLALQVPQPVHHRSAHRDQVAASESHGRLIGGGEGGGGDGDYNAHKTGYITGAEISRGRYATETKTGRVIITNGTRVLSRYGAKHAQDAVGSAGYCFALSLFRLSHALATTGSRLQTAVNDDQFQFHTREATV